MCLLSKVKFIVFTLSLGCVSGLARGRGRRRGQGWCLMLGSSRGSGEAGSGRRSDEGDVVMFAFVVDRKRTDSMCFIRSIRCCDVFSSISNRFRENEEKSHVLGRKGYSFILLRNY